MPILAWAASLLSPFKKWLAPLGLALGVLLWAFTKGRREGGAAEKAKQQAAVKKIERQWDAIDSAPGVADAAFDSLRRRNRSGR